MWDRIHICFNMALCETRTYSYWMATIKLHKRNGQIQKHLDDEIKYNHDKWKKATLICVFIDFTFYIVISSFTDRSCFKFKTEYYSWTGKFFFVKTHLIRMSSIAYTSTESTPSVIFSFHPIRSFQKSYQLATPPIESKTLIQTNFEHAFIWYYENFNVYNQMC